MLSAEENWAKDSGFALGKDGDVEEESFFCDGNCVKKVGNGGKSTKVEERKMQRTDMKEIIMLDSYYYGRQSYWRRRREEWNQFLFLETSPNH